MSLAGRLALLKEQLKKKPCSRCGFHYDPLIKDKCPRCGDLDDKGFQILLKRIEANHQKRKSLGRVFFIIALVITILMLLGKFV